MLIVLVSTISNSQEFLLKKNMSINAKAAHIFSAKLLPYMPYLIIKFLTVCLQMTLLVSNNWAQITRDEIVAQLVILREGIET